MNTQAQSIQRYQDSWLGETTDAVITADTKAIHLDARQHYLEVSKLARSHPSRRVSQYLAVARTAMRDAYKHLQNLEHDLA